MKSKKATKRALLSSALSLVLCFSMLLGTTFAWFTDSASTAVNTIQSGTLDVALKDATGNSLEGKALSFTNKSGSADILWEPGVTFRTQGFEVVNEGNLALKYKLAITGIDGDAALLDVIDFWLTTNKDDPTDSTAKVPLDTYAALAPNGTTKEIWSKQVEDTSATYYLVGHMKEEADNLYQNKTLDTVGITVYATQVDAENDSFDNQYDVDAPTLIMLNDVRYETLAEAIEKAASSDTIYISGPVRLAGAAATSVVTDLEGVTIDGSNDATLIFENAEGSNVTGTGTFSNMNLKNLTVVDETFYTGENGENAWEFTYLEFGGENTFDSVAFTDGIFVENGESTFTNCSFVGHNNDSSGLGTVTMYGAWVYSGAATFTGCDFTGTRGLKVADQYSGSDVTAVTVDNCSFGPLSEKPGIAVDNRNGELDLTIKNSTFYGTQPGDGANSSDNGVPYIYENDNRTPDDTTINLVNNKVLENTNTTPETDEDLEDALKDPDAKNIVVNLTSDLSVDVTAWASEVFGGEDTETVTINGNGHTLTFNHLNSDWNNIITAGAKLIINNAHVTNSGNNNGPWNRHDLNFACEVEMNNVTSDKAMAFKAGATLNNVTIDDANTSDTYAIWIQPNGQTVTLNGCTIDMLDCTDGRGIKIDEQYVDAPEKVTLNVSNTTFKTEEKAAILVKSVAGADIKVENIDISGVAADSTNAVWVDEASAAYADKVVVNGANKIVEP